jgi:hypothetical protein
VDGYVFGVDAWGGCRVVGVVPGWVDGSGWVGGWRVVGLQGGWGGCRWVGVAGCEWVSGCVPANGLVVGRGAVVVVVVVAA